MGMKKRPQTKAERILSKPKPAIGTYPGQNRSRKFKDRKKDKNKRACRGRVNDES